MKPMFCLLAVLALAAPAFGDDAPPAKDPEVAAPAAEKKHAPRDESNCLRETGSKIHRRNGECIPGTGRVMTHEDLERTGQINSGDAVNQAVPLSTGP